MDNRNKLWYKKPAEKWIEALPLGNGRMGAMVYGTPYVERIQLDESSFWSGAPSENNNRSGTKELMWKIRRALLEGDYEKADILGHGFVGNKNQYGTNMPVGELKLELLLSGREEQKTAVNYERKLNLRSGISSVFFQTEENTFIRECFVSNPDQVFCLKMTGKNKYSLKLWYEGIGNNTEIKAFQNGMGIIAGDARETLHSDGKHGVHLEGCAKINTDGTVSFRENSIYVEDAKKMELFIDLETTMFLKNPKETAENRCCEAGTKGYEECRTVHIKDVQALFDRIDISLGEEEKNGFPTDERIQKAAEGEEDLALYSLMYQYGRYLLIASSREDSPLPTHMGGIWNDNIYNRIDCTQDMHIDMNLQMQYWAAAQCNLQECYMPFFRYMEEVLIPSGTKTAKEAYGADGWTAHVVSNPWGFTSLGWAYNWGVWSLGGAWCAVMVWDYFSYTRNLEFLEKRGFKILEEAVKFVLDYVFWDEKSGCYMTGPSYSPENQFRKDNKNYFLALSNTCDVLLVRELLTAYHKAEKTLGKISGQSKCSRRAQEVRKKLPPYQVGKKGQLQEWFVDFEEAIPNHRHTSHLLGLYPFCQIQPDRDRVLKAAAEQSIAGRRQDFEITSWGMNMLIGYYARLKNGEEAQQIIRETFRKIVQPNLASVMADENSMWKGTWELDGNTGFTAAVTELLVQSSEEEISFLPALPSSWKNGYLKGICLKNGGKADVYWKDGKLEKAEIYVEGNQACRIRYGG